MTPISPLQSLFAPLALSAAVFVGPAHAQTSDVANEGRLVIDLLEGQEPAELDEFIEQQCQRDVDEGIIAGEIVVCRERSERTDGFWSKEAFERRYAEVSQGIKPADVDGTGLPNGMVPLITIRGCFIGPCPGEPALLIDVAGLPVAPQGSDADRIAHGLPPLGDEGDLGRGPISEDELVLPTSPG